MNELLFWQPLTMSPIWALAGWWRSRCFLGGIMSCSTSLWGSMISVTVLPIVSATTFRACIACMTEKYGAISGKSYLILLNFYGICLCCHLIMMHYFFCLSHLCFLSLIIFFQWHRFKFPPLPRYYILFFLSPIQTFSS